MDIMVEWVAILIVVMVYKEVDDMAIEYTAPVLQTVAENSPVIFTDSSSPFNYNRWVYHRDGSGIFRLGSGGFTNPFIRYPYPCCCNIMPESQYLVEFHANVSIPEDGTIDTVQFAVVVDGEIEPSSIMITNPTAVDEFDNIGTGIVVAVPLVFGWSNVSIRNISTQEINVQNASLVIDSANKR